MNSVLQSLVTANVPSSLVLFILMMEEIRSSETWILIRTTRYPKRRYSSRQFFILFISHLTISCEDMISIASFWDGNAQHSTFTGDIPELSAQQMRDHGTCRGRSQETIPVLSA
jgi:hypothetical protein